MYRGGCLCGGVRYEVEGEFIRTNQCHCSRCRRHSGSFGLMQGRVWREQFRLVQGADLIRVFGEEGHAVKAFCSACGSSIFGGTWPEGPQISIRLGTLDEPGIGPQFHTYIDDRAPWDGIFDDLPYFHGAYEKESGL